MAATGAQNYPVTALIGGPRDASGAGVWKGEEGLGQSKKASAAFQPALKGPMGPKEDPWVLKRTHAQQLVSQQIPWINLCRGPTPHSWQRGLRDGGWFSEHLYF